MAAEYRIREIRSGLEIAVTGRPSRSVSIAVSVAVAAIVGYVGYRLLPLWSAMVTVALGGAIAFLLTSRPSRAVLRATKFDFETQGEYPATVSRADIAEMFYDTAQGDEGSYTPAGLYANGRVCLLLFVNEDQANEIIQAIYRRFPDIPLKKDSRASRLTSLKLN